MKNYVKFVLTLAAPVGGEGGGAHCARGVSLQTTKG